MPTLPEIMYPARMNPNLAAQGRNYLANMIPPESVMDPRYAAWKKAQDDAEALGIFSDIALTAIPFAGVAAKNAMAAGRTLAPTAGMAAESYMNKIGGLIPLDVYQGSPHKFAPKVAGQQMTEPTTMRLFHSSPEQNLPEVKNSGRFGGIFAGSDPESAVGLSPRKTFLHHADIPESSIADSSILINTSENKLDVANNAVKNSISEKYHQPENIEAIKDVALNDRNIYNMIDPDTNNPTEELQLILKALGTDDLGEASWELQKIRGSIARDLGYKAVTMSDEQGLSYFLTPGTKLKVGKGE